jgi:energy-coupling factor transport system ATP-binding protein
MEPTRGRVEAAGAVALLLQNPGDYLLHDRVGDEAGAGALERAGLRHLADRDPGDLSGGERQRLALSILVDRYDDGPAPSVVALDEPTRGMDRQHRASLVARLTALAGGGVAVIVATHDAELAAAFADRVVLLGDGVVIADAAPADVLTGGWYFSTETARILGGTAGALLPSQGAAALRPAPLEVSA